MGEDTGGVSADRRIKLPKNIYIIGAGGVTTYFLPPFIKTVAHKVDKLRKPTIYIMDGDEIEDRNLERQAFPKESVKSKKSDVLVKEYAEEYGGPMKSISEFFHPGDKLEQYSLVFVFVDNHPARLAILNACDQYECSVIMGANEYQDSQGIYYSPRMKGTKLDPRVRYPEILEDESDNPIRAVGCNTEEALEIAPQLAIANHTAASHALQLFWFYFGVLPTLDPIETKPFHPVEHNNNFNRIRTSVEGTYAESAVASG